MTNLDSQFSLTAVDALPDDSNGTPNGATGVTEPVSAGTSDGADRSYDDIVVCSFYTADEYYRTHAETLRRGLQRLGIAHDLGEVVKGEGQDWADICRKKISFLKGVCDANPGKKVFWIDVDCMILSLPDYVADFTSDLIGFQRGFSSALTIGYGNRTRFWEPCFFGINATAAGRKFIDDAAALEAELTIKATDDYFFEESWRANANGMSFQVIPSTAVMSKMSTATPDVVAFFSFGASGNVEEFKGKVVQHDRLGGRQDQRLFERARRGGLRAAKRLEAALPTAASRSLRALADRSGVTHVLTNGGEPTGGAVQATSPHRSRLLKELVAHGQRGDGDAVAATFERLQTTGIPSAAEIATRRVADSFAWYADPERPSPALPLAWWSRPFPGNFGDWLSPLVMHVASGRSVQYVPPTSRSHTPHLISVGSIGRFIKPTSVVVGTGVSSMDLQLDPGATYISVRGPLTAELVKASGGPDVSLTGDPGVLLRRVFPVTRGATNGRIALVRHFTHVNAPLMLPDGMDELSVLMSHPESVREFVTRLNEYDAVVTSAMHVMITCHSYGIPCLLVTFEGLESSVHGTGMKYRDYALGAGLGTVYEPMAVGMNLRHLDVSSAAHLEMVSDAKLDEVEEALRMGISTLTEGV